MPDAAILVEDQPDNGRVRTAGRNNCGTGGKNQMMTRRGLFKAVAGIAAAAVLPWKSKPKWGTIGAINRAEFAFWRNPMVGGLAGGGKSYSSAVVAAAWEKYVGSVPEDIPFNVFMSQDRLSSDDGLAGLI